MRTQSIEEQGTEYFPVVSRRRYQILTILLSLNTFFLGGCVTLLIVNRLLKSQLDVYVATQSMAAAATILDFMDDLIPFYLSYGGGLLVLVLVTASVWTWMVTQSRLLRYGMLLMCLIVFVVLGGMWLLGVREVPSVQPTTPTPVGAVPLIVTDIL